MSWFPIYIAIALIFAIAVSVALHRASETNAPDEVLTIGLVSLAAGIVWFVIMPCLVVTLAGKFIADRLR